MNTAVLLSNQQAAVTRTCRSVGTSAVAQVRSIKAFAAAQRDAPTGLDSRLAEDRWCRMPNAEPSVQRSRLGVPDPPFLGRQVARVLRHHLADGGETALR